MTGSGRGTHGHTGESPEREAAVDRRESARSVRIQDEPESTIGRKPGTFGHPERPETGRPRVAPGGRSDER